MNIDQFEKLAKKPNLTKQELITLRSNAIKEGKQEFAVIAEEQLNNRFPTWQKTKKVSGLTPTTAVFNKLSKDFRSGKDAYIWLIEKLQEFKPNLLETQDRWHQKAFKGISRHYFAKEPKQLFPDGSILSESSGKFERISGKWYANINLNHREKFDILIRLGAICDLHYPENWDFKVTGSTQSLIDKQEQVILAEKLLKELSQL